MNANKISVWMKKRKLSYEWMVCMLYQWFGVATNSQNCRTAISSDVNNKLQTNMLMVMEKYDNLMGMNDE